MELVEPIDEINKKLKDNYGLYEDGRPNFRIVFSEDQYEKRFTNYTDEGLELLHPEVRLLPKYKQWITAKYILERLVPAGPETDLVEKINYEPCWVFQDKDGNYLPPTYDMCKFPIEALHAAAGHKDAHARYRDPAIDPEFREEELRKMQEKLFGNDTDVIHALRHGYGVGYTGPSLAEKEAKEKLVH